MNCFSPRLLRGLYVLIVLFCGAYLTMQGLRHTGWYKQRLSEQLRSSDHRQQVMAAAALVQLGAEQQLLDALKLSQPEAREVARRALEYLWFNAAGDEAYQLLQAAHQAAEKDNMTQALETLDMLTGKFPQFAEGWNRRAAAYWQMGEYVKSLADCERALALNPHHYGAWQGLGICRLQAGDVAEACRCLRAALKIIPHDSATRETLLRCEELLRSRPGRSSGGKAADLI